MFLLKESPNFACLRRLRQKKSIKSHAFKLSYLIHQLSTKKNSQQAVKKIENIFMQIKRTKLHDHQEGRQRFMQFFYVETAGACKRSNLAK
jgi:hypothetical protein